MKNGAKVQTFIQLRKSSILYEWLWMVRGAATEKYGCALRPIVKVVTERVQQPTFKCLFFLDALKSLIWCVATLTNVDKEVI